MRWNVRKYSSSSLFSSFPPNIFSAQPICHRSPNISSTKIKNNKHSHNCDFLLTTWSSEPISLFSRWKLTNDNVKPRNPWPSIIVLKHTIPYLKTYPLDEEEWPSSTICMTATTININYFFDYRSNFMAQFSLQTLNNYVTNRTTF